jgi:amidase
MTIRILKTSIVFCLMIMISNSAITQTNTEWHELSVEELSKALKSKKTTSVELTRYFINRINHLDKPDINSVIVINPDALSIAEAVDLEIAKGKYKGSLHGIPILIKDNIDTRDKMPNTAGSLLLKENFPKQDAHIVKLMRENGAVLLGKTNLSEWANFRSEKSASGWSSYGGQTLNFHNKLMTPCGSSSGSAAAMAAGFAPLTIGTETNGSISCPASVNGVVGIKPTVGVWSRSGIIPISHTQDTGGPMSKSVKDAAILLGALTKIDAKDSMSAKAKVYSDYTLHCKKGYLKGKRIGVDTSFLNLKSELGGHLNRAISLLKKEGVIIVPISYRSIPNNPNNGSYEILLYEFTHGVEKYLSTSDLEYKTVSDLIAGNKQFADRTMPHFGQEIFEKAAQRKSLKDTAYTNAIQNTYRKAQQIITDAMKKNNLIAIIGPTLGHAWPINYEKPGGFNGPSAYGLAARAGFPHITLPMGTVENLPVGLCIFGMPYTERELIGIAHNYETSQKKQ